MVSDELVEKHSEDIESLMKEVRSLKTRLGKLTSRVEQLGLMDFQEQLNRLNERIGIISEALLISSRNIARFIILSTCRDTKDIIYREKPNADRYVITQLLTDAKGTRTEVDKTTNPLLNSAQFENKCLELLKSLGIKTVIV